ncbi:MAG: type II toxin-antitoxin system VapC family toxin [Gemmatimonadales bacterium]
MTSGRERRYALDTNLFIQGYRTEAARGALEAFLQSFAPFCYLPAVVAQELLAGVRTAAEERALGRHLIDRFERHGRLLAPSAQAWLESGRVLRALAQAEGLALARLTKAFGNDVLLAVTCRESGVCLVTENVRDFARIRRHLQFEYTAPWPAPA